MSNEVLLHGEVNPALTQVLCVNVGVLSIDYPFRGVLLLCEEVYLVGKRWLLKKAHVGLGRGVVPLLSFRKFQIHRSLREMT